MESEHKSTAPGGSRTNLDFGVNSVDPSTAGKKLRSSSSKSFFCSPDSPFHDTFQEEEYETDECTGTSPTKLHEDAQLASRYGEKDVSGSLTPKDEESNHELPVSTLPPVVATESPPMQAMERSGDDSYRIPSSVFARTKSTAPVEWSVASNESLFSIHMGNTSFSKDPMFWRSGELGLPGEQPTTSAQMFNFSPNQPPVRQTTDTGKSSEGNVAEASVETMKEVIRENAEDKSNEKSSFTPSVSGRSDLRGASVKSFAFPILTGHSGKGGLVGGSVSVRAGSEHLQPQTPRAQMQPQPQPEAEAEPQLPQAKQEPPSHPPVTGTKLFACFTCCTSCS